MWFWVWFSFCFFFFWVLDNIYSFTEMSLMLICDEFIIKYLLVHIFKIHQFKFQIQQILISNPHKQRFFEVLNNF